MGQKGKPGIIFLILGMAFIALGIESLFTRDGNDDD